MNMVSPAATEQHKQQVELRKAQLKEVASKMRILHHNIGIYRWVSGHSLNIPGFDEYQITAQLESLDLRVIDEVTGIPACREAVLHYLVENQIVPFSVPWGLWTPIPPDVSGSAATPQSNTPATPAAADPVPQGSTSATSAAADPILPEKGEDGNGMQPQLNSAGRPEPFTPEEVAKLVSGYREDEKIGTTKLAKRLIEAGLKNKEGDTPSLDGVIVSICNVKKAVRDPNSGKLKASLPFVRFLFEFLSQPETLLPLEYQERLKREQKSEQSPPEPTDEKNDPAPAQPTQQFFLPPLKSEELPSGEDIIPPKELGAAFRKWHMEKIPIFADQVLTAGYFSEFSDRRPRLIANLYDFQSGTMARLAPTSPSCHRVVGACLCYLMGVPRARWPKKYRDVELSEFMPKVEATDPAQHTADADTDTEAQAAAAAPPAIVVPDHAEAEGTLPDDEQPKQLQVLTAQDTKVPFAPVVTTPNPPMPDDPFASIAQAMDDDPEATMARIFQILAKRISDATALEARVFELEHKEQPAPAPADPEEVARLTNRIVELEYEIAKERTAKEGALESARLATANAETWRKRNETLTTELTSLRAKMLALGGSLTGKADASSAGKNGNEVIAAGKNDKAGKAAHPDDDTRLPEGLALDIERLFGSGSSAGCEAKRLINAAREMISDLRDCKALFEEAGAKMPKHYAPSLMDNLVEQQVDNIEYMMKILVPSFTSVSAPRKASGK